MEFISGRHLTKQQFLQANDKLYEGVNYLQKTSDLSLNTDIIKQAHRVMMEDEKEVLGGDIESHLYSQVIIFLHRPSLLKNTWKAQFLGFIRLKKMIQLWLLQIYLETLLISIHLNIEMEEFVA